jgi:hypothetical protein
MELKEILERNSRIATMLGWEYIDKDSHPTAYENYGWWKVGTYHKDIDARNNENWKGFNDSLNFHKDWNKLMIASSFIKKNIRTSYNTEGAKFGEIFIDEWEFKINRYYIRLIQWKDGWKMFDESNRNLSILYIIGENCHSELEAVFKAISDFAKLYNENK